LVKKNVNGRTVYRWIKIHERNEPLDCRIYARAAASMFGMDRFSVRDWDQLEGKNDVPKPKVTEEAQRVAVDKDNLTKKSEQPKNDYWARQKQKKSFW
jgi:phage terminase large subunit GpA-like protein